MPSTYTLLLALLVLASCAHAQTQSFEDIVARHPAGVALKHLVSRPQTCAPTGLTKKDYLLLVAGNVDFWKKFQNNDGAIIDFYENAERQYSTPAFALSAAELVKEAGRDDLLEPAVRAFSFALTAP